MILSTVRAASEGLAHGLRHYLPRDILAHGSPGDALPAVSHASDRPTTLVLDGSATSELQRLHEIGRVLSTARVVVYGLRNAAEDLRCCARHRVDGLVGCDAPMRELAEAIEAVSIGGSYTSSSLIPRLLQLAAATQPFDVERVSRLTDRERQVAGMLARGLTYAQIAQDLALSPATVKNHVHNIYRKARDAGGGERAPHGSMPGRGTSEWPLRTLADRSDATSDE